MTVHGSVHVDQGNIHVKQDLKVNGSVNLGSGARFTIGGTRKINGSWNGPV